MSHGMEQLSINMFWLALAATAMATLLYWGHAFDVNLWVGGLHSYLSV
jgi:hypothetical protein